MYYSHLRRRETNHWSSHSSVVITFLNSRTFVVEMVKEKYLPVLLNVWRPTEYNRANARLLSPVYRVPS